MNFRLIFLLSLSGLAMALATISLIPEKAELPFWILIFIINAYIIVKNTQGRYFLTGLMVSLFNCVYITAAHILAYSTYVAHHPMAAEMGAHGPFHNHPRMGMLIFGPLFGIGFGIIQGLFAVIAGAIFKKNTPAAQA